MCNLYFVVTLEEAIGMKVRKTYTHKAFKQAVEQLKAEGHIFLGYTWNYACFKDIAVERCF